MIAKASPGVFRYGQLFQRGDLPIFITDTVGSPFDPFSIRYTLLYQPKDAQCLVKAGACGRTPVKADTGEYYATGYAGECGQPGQWYIRWCIQEYFDGPLTTQEFGFSVYDTAAFCAPNGGLPRQASGCGGRRHGWNCGGGCSGCSQGGW